VGKEVAFFGAEGLGGGNGGGDGAGTTGAAVAVGGVEELRGVHAQGLFDEEAVILAFGPVDAFLSGAVGGEHIGWAIVGEVGGADTDDLVGRCGDGAGDSLADQWCLWCWRREHRYNFCLGEEVSDERHLYFDGVLLRVGVGIDEHEVGGLGEGFAGEVFVDVDGAEGCVPLAGVVEHGEGLVGAVYGAEDDEGVDGVLLLLDGGQRQECQRAAEDPTGVGDDAAGDVWGQVGGQLDLGEHLLDVQGAGGAVGFVELARYRCWSDGHSKLLSSLTEPGSFAKVHRAGVLTLVVYGVGAVAAKEQVAKSVFFCSHGSHWERGHMGIKATEMKKGMVLKIDNEPCMVLDYQHVKLGKGGAVLQTKLKNILTGTIITQRIRSEESLEQVFMDKQPYEYLYSAAGEHVFMHKETYDQITVQEETFGDGPKYCKPNTDVEIHFYDGKPLTVILPNSVELEVSETPPPIKGATATNQYKPATLETGVQVQVPPFVEMGEVIRVDTRTGQYLERVKK